MRHPCERGRQYELKQLIFLSVREALYAPAHPDSKRQERNKRRDLERYGARLLKESRVLSCPATANIRRDRKREIKRFTAQLWQEQKVVAHIVARRLNGKEITPYMQQWLSKKGYSHAA